MSGQIEVGNCPTCGHFPTQAIAGEPVQYKALPPKTIEAVIGSVSDDGDGGGVQVSAAAKDLETLFAADKFRRDEIEALASRVRELEEALRNIIVVARPNYHEADALSIVRDQARAALERNISWATAYEQARRALEGAK